MTSESHVLNNITMNKVSSKAAYDIQISHVNSKIVSMK